MQLNTISDNYGSRYKSKRLGRGIGSGKGKTCGRGYKGQKARTGVAIKGFEGGQMPLYRRLPKRGFTCPSTITYKVIDFNKINSFLESKKFKKTDTLTKEAMYNCGLIDKVDQPVKLLSSGDISYQIKIEVDAASKSAQDKVEKAKGTITIVKSQ